MWNPESWTLESAIQRLKIRNPTNGRIHNPSFTYKENGIHFAEQSRQNPRLSWIPLQEINDISKTLWPQWFFLACKEGVVCRGTQREILRKRPKNNNKAWIKLSEAILSILGDCWENFSVPHPQQDWWKSSQPARCTYNIQPDWLRSFLQTYVQSQFGCGHRAKFSPSVGWGGGKEVCQIAHTSYSKHQIPTDHSDVTISQQPFLFKDISFFPNTPATKN